MEEIRLLEIEIAKHRKLLNRAVGNKIIPDINYHHYHIIELLSKLKQLESDLPRTPVLGIITQSDYDAVAKFYTDAFQKAEDHYILTGEMPNEKSLET